MNNSEKIMKYSKIFHNKIYIITIVSIYRNLSYKIQTCEIYFYIHKSQWTLSIAMWVEYVMNLNNIKPKSYPPVSQDTHR